MRTLWLVMLVVVQACGGESGSDGFCGAVEEAPLCDPSSCDVVVEAEQRRSPTCATQLDTVLSCVTKLGMSCSSQLSYQNVHAVGDQGDSINFVLGERYQVFIEDTTCARVAEGFVGCTQCPDAPGASSTSSTVVGLGEVCGAGKTCADGTTCEGGLCTMACTDSCPETRTCASAFCAAGKCRASCFDDDDCPTGTRCQGFDEELDAYFCQP